MDTGENERKRLWDIYLSELRKTAAKFAAEKQAEPVVFLCDVRDSMARKIADYFIDEDQAKRLLTKYRKKRVLPIVIGALSKKECVSKKVLERISPSGPKFLRMRPQPGCVRAVLIAAGGVSYAGDLPSDSEQYSSS